MEPAERVIQLLEEIRDLQREAAARSERSMVVQDEAVRRQRQFGRLYQGVLVVSAVLVAAALGFLIYLWRT